MSMLHRLMIGLFGMLAMLLPLQTLAQDTPLSITASPDLATAGFFRLTWEGPASQVFVLQESNSPSFTTYKTLYAGSDTASVLSGKVDGVYYYRIGVIDIATSLQVFSEVIEVTVRHHPLARAFLFFGMGAFMFVVLIVVIWRGTSKAHA